MIIKITELAYIVRKKCKGTNEGRTFQTQTSEKNKQRRKLGTPIVKRCCAVSTGD